MTLPDPATLGIVPRDHPALNRRADPVTSFDADLLALAAHIDAVRAGHGGVGIAAPQLGVPLRLFLISDRLPDGSRSERYGEREIVSLAIANPEIISASEESENDEEGCLSLPDTLGIDGLRYSVPRAKSIAYEGHALDGSRIAGELTGFMARVFQHEYDHLEGLLIDRFEAIEPVEIA